MQESFFFAYRPVSGEARKISTRSSVFVHVDKQGFENKTGHGHDSMLSFLKRRDLLSEHEATFKVTEGML